MGKRFAVVLFLAAAVVGGAAPAVSALPMPWDSHRVVAPAGHHEGN
ncbi:putative secreted protein [Streptomyces davaonensis JCM 4913]|uniref:Putative secreted protein n=1 Tax=Streptomyces davaonensis (strain DSM 101723 / JCM 4913 / KCC S-0913 / 768) TaxID=1214101 RepID=K4RAT3_STRDJ|nr:putative secreted protein [Streptomyces davaonensis JCM 4913]